MFDFSFSPSELAPEPAESALFVESAQSVRDWLASYPTEESVLNHLPALELALAAHDKYQDTALLALAAAAAERINVGAGTAAANETLAALLQLNLHLLQLTRGAQFEAAAHLLIGTANARWDAQLKYFRERGAATGNVFWTAPNAKLGEAFYLAWRVLGDETLRPKAGEILGHVSALFDTGAGLYESAELPDKIKSDPKHAGAYAAAMQMFLTATETTGRRTYMARACMLADYALNTLEVASAPLDERAALADALVRLDQFMGESWYREQAHTILKNAALEVAPDKRFAPVALAAEHAAHFPLHVVIIGDMEKDDSAVQLWLATLDLYASTRAIEVLHPALHAARIQQLGYFAPSEGALAYICSGTLCLPPVSSVGALRTAMERIHAPVLPPA